MVRFSVVIPTHNRHVLARETIDSVLSQTKPAAEIIVVDDASTDETHSLLESYGKQIRAVRRTSAGGGEVARNSGARIATGSHLVFLDDDDLLHPQALEVYGCLISARDPVVVIAKQEEFVAGDDLSTFNAPLPGSLSFVEYDRLIEKDRPIRATASIFIIRRSVFEAVGGFRDSTPATFFLDDLDLMLRIGFSGPALHVLAPATVAYRYHEGNSVHNCLNGYAGMLRILRAEKGGRYPGGRAGRWQRRAYLGGPALYWVARMIRSAPLKSLHLLTASFPMAVAALARQVRLRIFGRREPRIIPWSP